MKVLPGGWSEQRLDQWGTIVSGSTPSTTVPDFWDGDIVWVTPADLSRLTTPYLFDSGKRLTKAGLASCSARLMSAGNVVLSSRAPIGYVALPKIPFCTNQGCKSLMLNEGVDPEFAYYSLLFNVTELKKLGEGTTFAEISKAALATVALPLPADKSEQAKIGEILAAADRAIEHTEVVIAKHERIKSGLMGDLLTRGMDENGEVRSEGTHKFKDSPLGKIPVDWEVEPLKSACERVSVGIATSTTKHFRDEGVPLLRNQNVLNGRFDLRDLLYISPHFDNANHRKRLRSGDLVTMRTGDPGRTAVVTEEMEGWQTFTTLISTPKKQKYISDFMCLQMNSLVGRRQVATLQGGGAQQNLNVGWLVNLQVIRPPRDEQERIAACLGAVERSIEVWNLELSKLRSVRIALMADLLTGRRRVTPLLNDSIVEKVA